MNDSLKKKIIIFVLVGVLLILLITGGLIYFLVDKDDVPKQNKDKQLYSIVIDDYLIKVYDNKIVYNNEDIKYSKENVNKFKKFIKNNYEVLDNKLTLKYDDLEEYHKMVMLCIIESLSEVEFEVAVEEYEYSVYLTYGDYEYVIYLKDNGNIHVKKVLTSADGLDILEIEQVYDLKFSKDKMESLRNYIKSLFDDDQVRQLYKSNVRLDEEGYIKSIVYNDDSYITEEYVQLLYSLSYEGINCLTPTLYLYSDNTYEYYYTFGTDMEQLVPKKGTYNYDINSILNESVEEPETERGFYTLIDEVNNNSYYLNVNSSTIGELLTQTDTNLSTCLVQQGFED